MPPRIEPTNDVSAGRRRQRARSHGLSLSKEIRVRAEKARCGGTCVEWSGVDCSVPGPLPAPKAHRTAAARAQNSRVKTCEGLGEHVERSFLVSLHVSTSFFFNPNQKRYHSHQSRATGRGKKKSLLWGEGAVAVGGSKTALPLSLPRFLLRFTKKRTIPVEL